MKHFNLSDFPAKAVSKVTLAPSIITLTGSSGTANIEVQGILNKTIATYATSLTVTAAAWVLANQEHFLHHGFWVTAAAGVITIVPKAGWKNANTVRASITNASGNLAGTYISSLTVDGSKGKVWDIRVTTAGVRLNKPTNVQDKESIMVFIYAMVNTTLTPASGVTLNSGASSFGLTADIPYAIELVYDKATDQFLGTMDSAGGDLTTGTTADAGTTTLIDPEDTVNKNLGILDRAIVSRAGIMKKFTIGGVAGKAVGTITVSGTPVADETIQIGETVYTFKAVRGGAGEITIDADNAAQVTNIITATDLDSTDVVCTDGAGDTVVVTAAVAGAAGNLLTFTSDATGIAMDGSGVLGGTTAGNDAVEADFNFSPDANITEQSIELEVVIPSLGRLLDVLVVCNETFTGAGTLVADVGQVAGGDGLISVGSIFTEDEVLYIPAENMFTAAPSVIAGSIFINFTPGADWVNVTAGKCTVYVTVLDPELI